MTERAAVQNHNELATYMEYLAKTSVRNHGDGWEASARACMKEAAGKLRSIGNGEIGLEDAK